MIPVAARASALLAGLGLSLAAAAGAQCEVGNRPGSTLLFPYFEVDLGNTSGVTTLISVNSAKDTSVLARVVVWTDWGEPVLSFDIFLRPQDIQTMNMRDVLTGYLPSTGGPELPYLPGCTANPPTHPNPVLDPYRRDRIVDAVTGAGVSSCKGERYPDEHARGYVTVDTVNGCSAIGDSTPGTPKENGYFTNLATVDNVLWGDLLYVDPSGNSAQGVEAVALRGDDLNHGSATVNSFYGKFVSWNGSDKRSPLPTRWTTRFLNGGVFDGGTAVIIFRDTRRYESSATCGNHPSWYPLFDASFRARDEDGNVALSFGPNGLFGLATQKVAVATLLQSVPTSFGRLDLDLAWPNGTPAGAWVMPVMTAAGRFSVDFNAQPIDTGCGLGGG